MKICRVKFLFAKVFLVLGFIIGFAQLPKLPKIPDLGDKILGIDKILEGKPPITTSLSDAVTDIEFLDDFDPQELIPMNSLPRTAEGGFILVRPGLYAYNCQSYCLKAGTHLPAKGAGHLYAPLKGPQAQVVQKILRGSYAHNEISQRNIQVLLWAIIARTKISDMPREMQLTAAKLLTPKEIFDLNGGALALIPDDMMSKAFEKVPEPGRTILEAEAKLRTMFTRTSASYEELERVAVIPGVAPTHDDDREVPAGRWSYHPDGFFIRYFPSGYAQTEIQLSVPEPFDIKHDNLGRITLIADRSGNRIEIAYNDRIKPLTIDGDPNVRGYMFGSLRFVFRWIVLPDAVLDLEETWLNNGWVYVGIPSGKFKEVHEIAGWQQIFGAEERYEQAKSLKEQIELLDKHLGVKVQSDDLINLGHLKAGLRPVIENDHTRQAKWPTAHLALMSKAWQFAFSRQVGGYLWGCSAVPSTGFAGIQTQSQPGRLKPYEVFLPMLAFASDKGGAGGTPVYDPSANVATPGNTGSQRKGKSGRPSDSLQDIKKLKAEIEQEKALLKAFQDPDLLAEAMKNKWPSSKYYDKVKEKAAGGLGKKPGDWDAPMEFTTEGGPHIQYNWGDGTKEGALQKYIELFGNIVGPILFNADYVHEMTHFNQYNNVGDPARWNYFLGSPDNYSDCDQEAYKASINEKGKALLRLQGFFND